MYIIFIAGNSLPSFGLMSVSGVLKTNGHKCELLLLGEEKDVIGIVAKKQPDLVGFSCFTGKHNTMLNIAKRIRQKGIKVVLGGPHPTYYPEVINEEGVDIIVRGEAEGAMLELAGALDSGKDITSIGNLWVKKDGNIYENELRPLIENLDSLPFPDRELYYKYSFLRKSSVKQFLTGRGCPYICSFCSNHLLRKMYAQKGDFVRRRHPDNVIEEMRQVKSKYGFKTVSFTDDTFILDARWLQDFLPKYRNQIKVPFMCNVRANLVNEAIIKLLKSGGCYGVAMGIEAANEKIRNEVLMKNISDEQILSAGNLIKSYGLVLKTYSMLCVPQETVEDGFKTLELNARIKADHAACSLLVPYPRYYIAEYAIKNGFLKNSFCVNDVPDSIYKNSPIDLKDKRALHNLQSLFILGVKFPALVPLIRKLIKLPPNVIYRLLSVFLYGFYASKAHRLTIADMVRYALHLEAFKT